MHMPQQPRYIISASVTPELHEKVQRSAKASNISINKWLARAAYLMLALEEAKMGTDEDNDDDK
jgi:HicB family